MFKFKTKKDRKIEDLEKEINRLNTLLLPTSFIRHKQEVITWFADYTVPFEQLDIVPQEHIKRVLANKMLEVVENNLEVDSEDEMCSCMRIFRARLNVVKK